MDMKMKIKKEMKMRVNMMMTTIVPMKPVQY